MPDGGYPAYTPAIPADLVPVGVVIPYAGAEAPSAAWGLCDGSLYSNADLPELFAAIGTRYGGNGTPLFAVPDLTAAFPLGPGNGRNIAATGGEEEHQLTLDELPDLSHAHFLQAFAPGRRPTDLPFAHGVAQQFGNGVGLDVPVSLGGSFSDMGGTAFGSPNAAGHDGPHNNLPPYVVLNFLIRLT